MKNSKHIRYTQHKSGFAIPLIIAIIAILVIGGGIYYYSQKAEAPKSQEQNQNLVDNATTTGHTTGWKTYANSQYGFEFKYPETKPDATKGVFFDKDEINLPIAEEGMHTNIDAKVLNVTIKPQINNSACVGPNYYAQTSKIVINGVEFTKGTGGEGAAGHGYAYADYTTSKNNTCITMAFTVSSFNDLHIPEYTGGKPFVAYDFSKEELLLNQIISTFKFTK